MKHNYSSLFISICITHTAFVCLTLACIIAPMLINIYDTNLTLNLHEKSVYVPLTITVYITAPVCYIALFALNKLLMNIKKGSIFVIQNTNMISILSYCCYAVALIFFVFGFIRTFSFVIFFAGGFFGLILRVLKNVFARAVELREENDFTI